MALLNMSGGDLYKGVALGQNKGFSKTIQMENNDD